MNEQLMTAGLILVNTLLQRAMQVSSRIQAGTLTQEFLDAQTVEDDAARQRQLDSRDRAKSEGR